VPIHPARELYRDLKRAGIPRRIDGLGKMDFHACRVAYTTLVVESGANVKEAQELLRHSTPQLTMEAYARARSERLGRVADSVGQKVLGDGQISAPTEPPLPDSDLQRVASAWARLPASIRNAIMVLLEAVEGRPTP